MSEAPATASPKRLRVAVLNRNFAPSAGGAERYSIALVEELASRHDMHVFAQTLDHEHPKVTYHRVSMPLRKPRWFNQLWYATATWWATRNGFDIVHSHENTWHGDVQTVHVLPVKHNLFNGRSGLGWLLRWIKVVTSPRLMTYLGLERSRYAPKPGRKVVVTSETLSEFLRKSYAGSEGSASVITPGIDLPPEKDVEARLHSRRQARVKLGLPVEGRCLLLIGNDYRKKGLGTLLDALVQFPADVYVAVVGGGEHAPAFKAQADALNLSHRVFFIGALKQVNPAYEAADMLVHPTVEDTFAMVVLEALAHSLPVIVSSARYCGISGLLKDGVNALLLADPKNVDALAAAIKRVLDEPDLADRLVRGGREFASHYQWKDIALQQEALYFESVAAKTGSSS